MIKKLSTFLVLILLLLALSVSGTMASGKMEVKIGSKVTLQGESRLQGATFKWILKRGNEIISTQTNRIFSYTFTDPGTYSVNVTATDRQNEIESTSIELLVGDRYPRPAIPVQDAGIQPVKLNEGGKLVTNDGQEVVLSTSSQIVTDGGQIVTVQDDGRMTLPSGEFVTFNSNGQLETSGGQTYSLGTSSRIKTIDGQTLHVSPTGQLLLSDEANLQFAPNGNVITPEGDVLQVSPDGQVLQVQSAGEAQYSDALSQVQRIAPLNLQVSTLPPADETGVVHLIGDSKVSFYLGGSTGEILEYRIDRNIYVDSDGDGNANNDIDNADDDSYLTGRNWETSYQQGESPRIVAEATVVNRNGQKASKQIEFTFDEPPTQEGDPVAQLDVNPAPNLDDGIVYVHGDEAEVAFYAKRSKGSLREYRIDRNIFQDSDGDGDPANDIDNLNDPSFNTGDVWTTTYQNTDDQIIAQLIVVGDEGRGSRIQVGIEFTEKPEPEYVTVRGGVIRLSADKDFVLEGDPITYTVTGLQQDLSNYAFAWDFDGDGTVDKETEAQNSVQHIYDTPGSYDASVTITDADGNSGTRSLAMIVKESLQTIADFEYEIDGNTVSFINESTANNNLADKRLQYSWSFGDPDEANFLRQEDQVSEENPVYTYAKAGTYLVTLTVTDAEGVTDSRSAEIVVAQDLSEVPAEGPDGEVAETPDDGEDQQPQGETDLQEEQTSLVKTILKILLYVVIASVALVILIFSGLLIFMKLQNPDLTFDELMEEVRLKMLSMLGVHEADIQAAQEPEKPGRDDLPQPPPSVAKQKNEDKKPEEAQQPKETVKKAPEQSKQESQKPAEQKPEKPAEQKPAVTSPLEEEPPKPAPEEKRQVIDAEEVSKSEEKPQQPQQANQPSKNEPPKEGPKPPPSAGPTPEKGDEDEQGPKPDWLKNV